MMEFFRDKQILITGNTGFKGSWLTMLLLHNGARVIGYSLEPKQEPSLYRLLGLEDRISQYFADIRDPIQLTETLKSERPEIVFHLAAQPLVRRSYLEPIQTFTTNAMGTAYLLQAIREIGCVRSTVVVTTDKVYANSGEGKPYREEDRLGGRDPYSASKACAELITHSFEASFFGSDLPPRLIATARAGNVIGGGDWSEDRLVPDLVRSAFETPKPLALRHPEAVREWIHVLDPLMGYLQLAKGMYEGDRKYTGAWNFAPETGSDISVLELVQKAEQILQRRIHFSHHPDRSCPEASILRLDASKAQQQLPWTPRLSLEHCLDWTFEWYRQFYQGEDVRRITERQISQFLERSFSLSS